jgi:hypothetical protein
LLSESAAGSAVCPPVFAVPRLHSYDSCTPFSWRCVIQGVVLLRMVVCGELEHVHKTLDTRLCLYEAFRR